MRQVGRKWGPPDYRPRSTRDGLDVVADQAAVSVAGSSADTSRREPVRRRLEWIAAAIDPLPEWMAADRASVATDLDAGLGGPFVPLTSTIRSFHSEVVVEPNDANGLEVTSAAQCQHIRAVSAHRVIGVRGDVGATVLIQLRETIAVILDLR